MEASQASEAGSIPVARSSPARPRAGRFCVEAPDTDTSPASRQDPVAPRADRAGALPVSTTAPKTSVSAAPAGRRAHVGRTGQRSRCATTSASWATRTPASSMRGASTWRSSITTTCCSRMRWRRTSRLSPSIPTRACCTATRTRSRSRARSRTLCSRLISTEICCTRTIASRIGSWCARTFWPRRACPTTR